MATSHTLGELPTPEALCKWHAHQQAQGKGGSMSHSVLCKPHETLCGRIAHLLSGPHSLRTRSEYTEILFLWNFGEWKRPNRAWIDVSKQVTQEGELTFNGPKAQPDKMMPMVSEIFGIKGVATVTLFPYKIVIDKGGVFSWVDIQQPVEDVIRKHLS